MKKNLLFVIVAFAAIFALAACGNPNSDPKVEPQFAGTWTTTYTDSEYDDGDLVIIKMKETVTYNVATGQFDGSMICSMTEPIKLKMCTITYSGSWCADKDTFTESVDKSSVDFEWHTGLMSKSDRRQFERDFLSEIDGATNLEIRSIDSNSFTLFDGEDEMTYTRKR